MAYLSFEKLTVWERSSLLYGKVNSIPFTPKHRHLQDQMLRSSLSISSNIAEGYERMNAKEVVYFLNVAKDRVAKPVLRFESLDASVSLNQIWPMHCARNASKSQPCSMV